MIFIRNGTKFQRLYGGQKLISPILTCLKSNFPCFDFLDLFLLCLKYYSRHRVFTVDDAGNHHNGRNGGTKPTA